jgi:biopolymer transport protein ExbB/TolQ
MQVFSETMSEAMRTIVGACQIPVIILLLAGAIVAIICVGSVVAEYFTEHRRFKVFLPRLVDELKEAGPRGVADVVKASGLLMRQKRYLVELTLHPQFNTTLRESMAVGLEKAEQRRYDVIVKITDMAARITPMLGLLGTLIPLGPGIIALSSGDTATLSASLTTAFDTTSMGLMEAAVFMLISAVRTRWYKDYMTSFDTAIEAVINILGENRPLGEIANRTEMADRAGIANRPEAADRAGVTREQISFVRHGLDGAARQGVDGAARQGLDSAAGKESTR